MEDGLERIEEIKSVLGLPEWFFVDTWGTRGGISSSDNGRSHDLTVVLATATIYLPRS